MKKTIYAVAVVSVIVFFGLGFFFQSGVIDDLRRTTELKDQTIEIKNQTISMLKEELKDKIEIDKNCEIAIDKCVNSRDKLIDILSKNASKCQPTNIQKKQSKSLINSNDAEWGQ